MPICRLLKCTCLPSAILGVINEKQRGSTSRAAWLTVQRVHWSVRGADKLWCYYTWHKAALAALRHLILDLNSPSTGQPRWWLSWERYQITAIALLHPEKVTHTHTHPHTSTFRGVFAYHLEELVNIRLFWKRRTGKLAARGENKKMVKDCMCSPQ